MRQHKYRAWDKKNKCWGKMNLSDWGSWGGASMVQINNIKEPDVFEHYNDIFYEWVQFTGLHDKNGKEIYESDILKTGGRWSNIIKVVEWIDHECRFNISMKCRMKSKNHTWEVIGNLYENKELLNDKQT